jgi:hypothetical protein
LIESPRRKSMHPSENAERMPPEAPKIQIPHLRLGALVAVALAAFFVAWFLLKDDGGKSSAATTGPSGTVSEAQLEKLADSTAHPVYWAGARKGFSYELTQTNDGRIFIRYLPSGVKAGDPRPNYLAIGTYPRANAFTELSRAARRKGAISLKIERGGLVVFNEAKPTNVYFGYPNAKYQVEVFSPSPETVRRLVLTGAIKPIT